MAVKLVLYLHGFRSSPQSFKSKLLAQWMTEHGLAKSWACPQLPVSPRESAELILRLVRHSGADPRTEFALIGSSLGGYYATWAAEQLGCRAALLNPATHPWTDLEKYLGEQPLWHGGGSIVVELRHLQELLELRIPAITRPERYYLLAAKGDEVLDYCDMLAAYPDTHVRLLEGSDHGISEFADYADEVMAFCLQGGG
ncbi:MAG: esterase [Candidatus Protistobacter heckmanni]|nr:esterase [Candidatus Protistobacter heckmanni]